MPIFILAAAAALGGGLFLYAAFAQSRIVIGYDKGKPYPLTVQRLSVKLQNGDAAWLRPDVAAAFEAMRATALQDNVNIQVASAFRSIAEQLVLYVKNKLMGPQTAPPGWSNHQQGTTVDLDTGAPAGTNSTYAWMQRRGWEFGFQRTVSSEPWHYEFLGVGARQGWTG